MKSVFRYFQPWKTMVPLIMGGLLLTGFIFVLDTRMPRRVGVEIMYILVVLLSLWSPKKGDALVLGLFCSIFVVLGYFFSAYPIDSWMVYVNMVIALAAVWVTSAMCYQRKRAVDDLKADEGRFRSVVESVPSAIIMSDRGGRIVLINAQAEKMFGYERRELVGQPVEKLIPDSMRTAHVQHRSVYQQDPQSRSMGMGRDLFGLRKDGTQVPLEIGLNPIQTREGHFILASIIDISERKQAEQERLHLQRQVLEVADAERRRIGQDLHDGLGQKLLGIGFLTKALNEDLAHISPTQASEAQRITQLINEALDQTRRLARGLYAAELQANDLPTALKQLAMNMRSMAGIECEFLCRIPPTAYHPSVAANLYRITQEALNNVMKHSQASRIEIILEQEGNRQNLIIKDNGIGLPETIDKNSGMGLQVIRYRANIIGATCDIRNDPHGGTVVFCSIPLEKKDQEKKFKEN